MKSAEPALELHANHAAEMRYQNEWNIYVLMKVVPRSHFRPLRMEVFLC